MSHRLCWLRPVPASEVMRWLASRGDFTILCSKIKAEPRWIALEISEVQLGDEFVLYDLHAHITLCKLDEETDESLDLRHVKDIAEFLLAQLRHPLLHGSPFPNFSLLKVMRYPAGQPKTDCSKFGIEYVC